MKSKTKPYEAQKYLFSLHSSTENECIVWPYHRNVVAGYASINYKDKRWNACRLLLSRISSPPTPNHVVAHSCGNGHLGCVNPNHLRWATRKENSEDMVKHGTSRREYDCNLTIIDRDAALSIYNDKRTQREIAKDFRISRVTVSDIKRGKSWSWATGQTKYDPAHDITKCFVKKGKT